MATFSPNGGFAVGPKAQSTNKKQNFALKAASVPRQPIISLWRGTRQSPPNRAIAHNVGKHLVRKHPGLSRIFEAFEYNFN
jgi:hypothetical protein